MQINNLGEFGLVQKIKEKFSFDLPHSIEGIGDDCAIILETDRHSLLVTTDMLIENIHFLRNDISPNDLGYKSLAVNISDIAAMGGVPQFAFLSLALPSNLDASWLEAFFSGFHDLATTMKVYLLGGDTNKSNNDITINVTLLGGVENNHIKRRSTAKIGDIICVTGFLGDSAAGLKCILDKLPRDPYLIKCHYRPEPAVRQGQWLSHHSSVHSMMDVSDGIDSDIKRIMESSSCGARIITEDIPISATLKKAAESYGFDSLHMALTGGEDYCLLLTIDPSAYENITKEFQLKFGQPLYSIGTIAEQGLIYLKNGVPFKIKNHGHDHFKKVDGNE